MVADINVLAADSSATKQVPSYMGGRPDIMEFLHNPGKVLDVGCNIGIVGTEIIKQFPNASVVGLDIQPEAIRAASPLLTEAHCIDLDDYAAVGSVLGGRCFDTIIAGDVLEHLKDPWSLMALLVDLLEPDGRIIVSIPNVGHWELMLSWIRQSWPRRERGIFDSTHLRFFMYRDIQHLSPPSAKYDLLKRKFRLRESGSRWDPLLGSVVGWVPYLREFFVFQYVFAVTRAASPRQ